MDLEELVTGKKGDKLFLLGNEAAVRGAIEAGVSIAATYPGTPSSEIGNILSILAKKSDMYFEFSTNEKVAMEVAASSAASGLRSFTFMKHVGLNVASDSFISSVYTGVEGGMVVLSADDPSMFSSQNEQDNRHYARLANLPVLEPSNPQEVKDMMVYGFELSEKFKIPVLIRTTTRVSHMRGIVELGDIQKNTNNNYNYSSNDSRIYDDNNEVHWKKGFFRKDSKRFVPVPENSIVMHKNLVEKMEKISEIVNSSDFNGVLSFDSTSNNHKKLKYGVIASGSAFDHIHDIINQYGLNMDILKIGFSYPFPKDLILDFSKGLNGIFVVEEVDPIMEKEILAVFGEKNINMPVFGKINGVFPMIYEYDPDIIKKSLSKIINFPEKHRTIGDGKETQVDLDEKLSNLKNNLPNRPPTLCPGCSHRSTYFGVRKAAEELGIVNEDLIFSSDIGCYTLGISPPYETTDYLLSMGSSIGDACGFSKATDQYVVSFIGDSTFFHGGIPPLINGVHNKNKFVVTVLDNRTTAMTGGQPNPGIPVDGMGDIAPEISIEKIAIACGCEFVETINPINMIKTIETYKKALEFDGVSVIIAKYPCTLIKGQKKRKPMMIKNDVCNKCLECVETLACPAISFKNNEVIIDNLLCKGCTTCVQMCNQKAIGVKKAD